MSEKISLDSSGVDYNAYPTARSFILGVNIGF